MAPSYAILDQEETRPACVGCMAMETGPLRSSLVELVRAWDEGSVDATQVRDTAEGYERDWVGWHALDPVPADDEPPSLAAMAEILSTLSDLHIRWVTRTDAPAILEALELWESDPVAAERGLSTYMDGVDWKARGRELQADPTYVVTDPSLRVPLRDTK